MMLGQVHQCMQFEVAGAQQLLLLSLLLLLLQPAHL
jgi:hypothetical protein